MSTPAATPEFAGIGTSDTEEAARRIAGLWWLWLVVGVAWIIASLVILQLDCASAAC
jgi:hypothetical protein